MSEPLNPSRLTGGLVAAIAVAASCAVFAPHDANASTSIALSVAELASSADTIVRVTQLEKTSAWEDGRIVTTTRARIDGVVAGASPGSEVSVRTLGGIVGTIGQFVDGEAELAPGEQAILFLAKADAKNTVRVVGRAQGRWSVVRDVHAHEIVRMRGAGNLVARRAAGVGTVLVAPKLASSLDGVLVNDATREAAQAWSTSHAR